MGRGGLKSTYYRTVPRPLLTSCSYRRTVEVISRDAEKNNKKASGKMEDEGKRGRGKNDGEKGREKREDFGNAVAVVIFHDVERTSRYGQTRNSFQ